MKILVFGPYARWAPHFETDLEIIQRHLDEGDEVVFLGCNAELMVCEPNPAHNFSQCMECMGRRSQGLSFLSKKIKSSSFYNLSKPDKQELSTLKLDFMSVDELKAYKIDNFDIGYGVLSSLISITRDPAPDLQAMAGLVRRLLISAFAVYRSIQNYLDRVEVDRVYMFNGRFAPLRAAMRACESKNVEFFTHERGHSIQHYALFENAMPHGLHYTDAETRRCWEAAVGDPNRETIASAFFRESRNGVVQSWYSFITEQQEGLLPRNWDLKKRNVAVFNSSEDEFAAVSDEWTPPLYRTQLEGMERILDSLAGSAYNIHLYLRVHPNLKGVKNGYTDRLLHLQSDFLTVIPPEDSVSTYALIDAADKVLTFGSTVGIEAVFWGKPSILAGQTYYRHLGGTYNPRSHEELMELLKADLEPKDKEAALMYGYYLKTFGIPFKYFKATDVWDGKFKGERVEISRWASIIRKTAEGHWRLRRLANSVVDLYARRKLGGKYLTTMNMPSGTKA